MSSNKNQPYHHGNLKQALIEAYIDLLPSTPPEKLSLRKLASHLGVAATAVYNHFSSKDELTTAVKVRCLNHLANYLDHGYNEAFSAEQNLNNLAKLYFRYSLNHAEFFKVIFSSHSSPEYRSEELAKAGMRAEENLQRSIAQLLTEHGIPANQFNEGMGVFATWSMAHGITTLAAVHVNHAACANDRWPPEFLLNDENAVNASFEIMTKVLINGIIAVAREGHTPGS